MIYLNIFITLLLLCLPSQPVRADTAPINESTMEKAIALLQESDLSRGNVSGIVWDIDIETKSKDKIEKNSLQVFVKGTACLAVYQSPSKVKGRKLLMKDRNMWFIKPGLSKPVPISPRQKLLGGASNGDIASTDYAGDYTIESFIEDRFNTEPCFLYELKAKNKKTTYDRIRYWVSKKRKVGLKAEFFTLSGKKFKTAFFEYNHTIPLNGEDRLFVSKMTILNAMIKTDKTVMAYNNINIREISASSFNLNLLVR
ncbi:MAG: outer membrane lipoprotein-sorting protein [Proteobacteria bacterium]|nr:outer membrane lipoprotein-sorting protein [Pseudomonadota bacterium]MBU1581294.1 outer membrane lipoprotein-sorting protein [Pseudomonadota bacterium]MBU2453917.1 outer membrane lipoprotein-sorting protein [Pseudomonadota bacterium]MBU2627048.1 outer membrane lipoprotein-sorting protein [Pseudomonadota bacterium]